MSDTPPPGFTLRHTLRGHTDSIGRIAWSPDGRMLASPSRDGTIRLWDAAVGELRYTIEGVSRRVFSVAWSPDGRTLASLARDGIRLWDAQSGQLSLIIAGAGIEGSYDNIVWSPDGRTLAWASYGPLFVHDITNGQSRRLTSVHSFSVLGVAWAPDSHSLAVGTDAGIVQLWNMKNKSALQRFRAHVGPVYDIAWSPDGRVLASGSVDTTIHLWNLDTEKSIRTLEGHTDTVECISFSADGRLMASRAQDGAILLWRTDTWEPVTRLKARVSTRWPTGLAFHPHAPVLATLDEGDRVIHIWDLDVDALLGATPRRATTHYTNAKVVLIGDSGVGKSGLALALTGKPFVPTESSHGRNIWTFEHCEVERGGGRTETRETVLWDLAGQPGYRVFHRLHLSEVAVALVLFDSRSETDPFAGVAYWARALDEATRGFPLVKFLVAARVDRGGVAVSQARIDELVARYGFAGYFETSARRGDGVAGLAGAVRAAIAWDQLPIVSAPKLFRDMKQFVVAEKEAGRTLPRRADLLLRYWLAHTGQDAPAEVFDACLGRLEAVGLIRRLPFGDLVLLQPEMLDDYCAWLAQAAQSEPDGLGFIAEQAALGGTFKMDLGRPLAQAPAEERLVLLATVQEVVDRGIARREETERGPMLVFPSELRADMPDHPGGNVRAVALRFEGPVRAIYATLAVRLINSLAFKKNRLYKNAALFYGTRDQVCGFSADYPDPSNDALGRLTVFFDPDAEKDVKLLFLRYVNQQLEKLTLSGSVSRERVYQCSCGYVIPSDAVQRRKELGYTTALCPVDGRNTPIDDLAEESSRPDERVAAIEADAAEEQQRQKRLSILPERERNREFHVFLCHNGKDKPDVRRLAHKLRDRGILPWIDEQGILAGGQFIPELERIVDLVPAAAVIVGPHSLGPWQKQEYYAFLQRFVERREERDRKRLVLVAVLLPGVPHEPDLPPFLRGFSWVDFRQQDGLDDRAQMRRLVQAILSEGKFTFLEG